jgi:hypothetical protein
MRKRNQVLQGFVWGSSGHYEVNPIQIENPLGALCDVKMPEMYGIEGSAEYSQPCFSQIGFPPQSGRLILAQTHPPRVKKGKTPTGVPLNVE